MTGIVDELLAAGRETAQALMDSTVLIRRATGTTPNPATGQLEKTWQDIYQGPARLRLTDADPQEVDAAGQRFAVEDPRISLPIAGDPRIITGTSAAIRVDDVGTVTVNDQDPGEVGTTFRLAGRVGQTHSTARRLRVEVLSHA